MAKQRIPIDYNENMAWRSNQQLRRHFNTFGHLLSCVSAVVESRSFCCGARASPVALLLKVNVLASSEDELQVDFRVGRLVPTGCFRSAVSFRVIKIAKSYRQRLLKFPLDARHLGFTAMGVIIISIRKVEPSDFGTMDQAGSLEMHHIHRSMTSTKKLRTAE